MGHFYVTIQLLPSLHENLNNPYESDEKDFIRCNKDKKVE